MNVLSFLCFLVSLLLIGAGALMWSTSMGLAGIALFGVWIFWFEALF